MNPNKKQLSKYEQEKRKQEELVMLAYKALRKAEKSFKNNCVASYLLQEGQAKCCFIIREILK